MSKFSEQKRFIKYWFAFFVLHLSFLLFAVWNVYAFRRLAPNPPEKHVSNDTVFNTSFLIGVIIFGVSFIFRKSFNGFMLSLVFCLLISLIGLIVLFAINSFYFLLWFIIGLLGMGIQLLRYQNSLEES